MTAAALSVLLVVAPLLLHQYALVNAISTFPATPLASKHFAYPTGLVSKHLSLQPHCDEQEISPTKPTLNISYEELKRGTTSAIQRPRIRIRFARRRSSMHPMVSNLVARL